MAKHNFAHTTEVSYGKVAYNTRREGFGRTCLIAYFLDYFADDTPRTLRSSHRAPEFCHFDETI